MQELRNLGHDGLTSYEVGQANQRIPDDEVLATATAAGRIVVTFNRNDFLALHYSGVEHRGIVICKEDRDRRGQAEALHQYFLTQTTLENRCIRVLKQNQQGSSQPVFVIREYAHK